MTGQVLGGVEGGAVHPQTGRLGGREGSEVPVGGPGTEQGEGIADWVGVILPIVLPSRHPPAHEIRKVCLTLLGFSSEFVATCFNN